MNAHVQEAMNEIAREAKAVVPCNVCGNYYVRNYDEAADRMAYAMATNAWNNGEQGFARGLTREEALLEMKRCLESASERCASCG